MRRRSYSSIANVAAVTTIAIAAALVVWRVLWRQAASGYGIPSIDIYSAHYPEIVYALNHVTTGHGLLWNSLQNCGQPFVPSTLLGLFYPLYALFLWLDPNRVYFIAAGVHLMIGGIGTYCLCRSLRCRPAAALCGGLAFTLGAPAVGNAVWLPTTVLGPYACMPWALWACERLLRHPGVRRGVLLGVLLSIQLLPGYPQISWFTYQLIVLRVLWELGNGRMRQRALTLSALGFALILPILLAGVQLYPMFEFAQASLRNARLTPQELAPPQPMTWLEYRAAVGKRDFAGSVPVTLMLIPMSLAAVSLTSPRHRRLALFWLLGGLLFLALVFDNQLSALYRSLPTGTLFRYPQRFFWIIGLASNVLVALGVDTLWSMRATPRRTLAVVLAMAAGAGAFHQLSATGFTTTEWWLCGGVVAAIVAALSFPKRAARQLLWAVVALLILNLAVFAPPTYLRLMTDGSVLQREAATFDVVRQRATAMDRSYIIGSHLNFALVAKSASIFGIASIDDYEPQTSARYAELFVRMLYGMPMRSINMHIFRLRAVPDNRPLLNLLATRFVVTDGNRRDNVAAMQPPLRLLFARDNMHVYENEQSLPRALFVPRLEVINDRAALLERLASIEHDPRRAILVSSAPDDGFLGSDPQATGAVEIIDDQSETLTMRVHASAAGFVSLQDQLYPGWTALVNDQPATILLGNYAFRAVRVPAGESRVVFRYRSSSVRLGIIATLAGILLSFVTVMIDKRR